MSLFPSLALSLLALVLVSCGGFSGQNSGAVATQSQVGSGTGSTTTSSAWQALSMDAAIAGGRFGATPVISLNKTTKQLLVRLPMLANSYVDGVSLNLPVSQISGASFGLQSLSGGGSALTLQIPLSTLMKGLSTGLVSSALPNGDALPGISGGHLPAITVSILPAHNINATLYMGKAILAIFVNTPFDTGFATTWPIRDASREHTYGYFSTIPQKSATVNGGFLLTIAIPDDVAQVIDNNI